MVIEASRDADGCEITTLTGEVVDQAALLGVLNLLHDLRLHLLSVEGPPATGKRGPYEGERGEPT